MIKDLKELYQYREMIRSLVHKELRGKYKGSVLVFFLELAAAVVSAADLYRCFFRVFKIGY